LQRPLKPAQQKYSGMGDLAHNAHPLPNESKIKFKVKSNSALCGIALNGIFVIEYRREYEPIFKSA
jgi:hypothetical protein